jgi:hypothetical protein
MLPYYNMYCHSEKNAREQAMKKCQYICSISIQDNYSPGDPTKKRGTVEP